METTRTTPPILDRVRVKFTQTTKGLITWEFTIGGDDITQVKADVILMQEWCQQQTAESRL